MMKIYCVNGCKYSKDTSICALMEQRYIFIIVEGIKMRREWNHISYNVSMKSTGLFLSGMALGHLQSKKSAILLNSMIEDYDG